jgi:hypothetical protein
MLPFFLAIFLRVFSKLFGMLSLLETEVVEVSAFYIVHFLSEKFIKVLGSPR